MQLSNDLADDNWITEWDTQSKIYQWHKKPLWMWVNFWSGLVYDSNMDFLDTAFRIIDVLNHGDPFAICRAMSFFEAHNPDFVLFVDWTFGVFDVYQTQSEIDKQRYITYPLNKDDWSMIYQYLLGVCYRINHQDSFYRIQQSKLNPKLMLKQEDTSPKEQLSMFDDEELQSPTKPPGLIKKNRPPGLPPGLL